MFNKGQLAGLMKQAQAMQDNLKKAQDELANIEVTGESGAGLVKVVDFDLVRLGEFLPAELADSALRKDLCTVELPVVNGVIPLPQAPGLGVTLNEEALVRYQVV